MDDVLDDLPPKGSNSEPNVSCGCWCCCRGDDLVDDDTDVNDAGDCIPMASCRIKRCCSASGNLERSVGFCEEGMLSKSANASCFLLLEVGLPAK